MEWVNTYILIATITGAVLVCLLTLLVLIRRVSYLVNKSKDTMADRGVEVLALAAHYFLTPLSVIRGNIAELVTPAAQSLSESQKQQYYVIIQANTNKLLLLVQNMLLVSSIDQNTLSVKPSPIDIMVEMDHCVADIHPEAIQKGLSVAFTRPDAILITQTRLDAEKFRQAMMNILSNAVKFTPTGGSIEVRLIGDRNQFLITVADSGIGIAPEETSRLFTRFHRGTSFLNFDYEGMGLGLYLAKYLVEANGGTITIQSKLHKGTLATLSIPIS